MFASTMNSLLIFAVNKLLYSIFPANLLEVVHYTSLAVVCHIGVLVLSRANGISFPVVSASLLPMTPLLQPLANSGSP